jgi:hypothetical protein
MNLEKIREEQKALMIRIGKLIGEVSSPDKLFATKKILSADLFGAGKFKSK